MFVHSVVRLLFGKRTTIAISYLFSCTRNGKDIILHFGNGKDCKEAVGNRSTTALFYFANTLIEKNQKIEKQNLEGLVFFFFFYRF